MSDAIAVDRGLRPWSLAALAEEAEFDLHLELAAAAIADHWDLTVHINVAARRRAYDDWIERVRAMDAPTQDYRALVSVCAALVASLAAHRIVGYTRLFGEPNRMIDAVLQYSNEVTALLVGGGFYSVAVEQATGTAAAEPLSALVVENAAANLRRHPEAALRFRELLRLTTPWT